MAAFHRDLWFARLIPRFTAGPRFVAFAQRTAVKPPRVPEDLQIDDRTVPGPDGAPGVVVRVYRSRATRGPAPAMLWIRGGGMAVGHRAQDEATNVAIVRRLGITVVSVEYRLTPHHPAPAALEDCYAALGWMAENASELGIDPTRIAVSGASAGGGLAAGVMLMALDRGRYEPAFQQLIYPMLDDRTVTRSDIDPADLRLWSPESNRLAWTTYLSVAPGSPGVSPYAAPARRDDLTGLPPTWIGVGTLDLFHDEDVAYARRLTEQDVACDLVVVPGAFHGFDLFRSTEVVKDFTRRRVGALERALFA